MMRKKMGAALLAASVIAGVGAGVVAHAVDSNEPTAARPTGSAGEGGEAGLKAPDDLTVSLGAVGPVKAGMTKAQALATGYFVADVKAPVDGCPDRPLSWKDEYVNTFDVQTLEDGEIRSIGIRGTGVRTADGLEVGSTWDEVHAVYPDAKLIDAGYLQSGISPHDPASQTWLGFLFDSPPGEVKGSDKVSFMEVAKGFSPRLMRDGC